MVDPAATALRVAACVLVLGAGLVAVAGSDGGRPSRTHLAAARPERKPATSAGTTAGPSRRGSVTAAGSPPAAGTPLYVVALGDSVPTASTCACDGYVEQVGVWLQRTTHRPTVVRNDAVDGWTTADVEGSLGSATTRADLAHAALVIIEIGANDFDFGTVDDPSCFQDPTAPCWAGDVRAMRGHLLRIVADIRRVDSNPQLRVVLAGYWNVTVDGKVGRALGRHFTTGSDVLTRLVNTTIEDAARHTGSTYVDFYAPLKGLDGSRDPTDDLLGDGDHPNQAGHTLLTRALITTLEGTGVVAAWSTG